VARKFRDAIVTQGHCSTAMIVSSFIHRRATGEHSPTEAIRIKARDADGLFVESQSCYSPSKCKRAMIVGFK
jgi:hypothetical protein